MMKKLNTVQKVEKLNTVYAVDEKGPGNANHEYIINRKDGGCSTVATIQFQKGPRNEEGSVPGVIDADLLEIVRDRLKGFQSGEFSCRENACALTHIEEALMWLDRRVMDRYERKVLGTYQK